MKVLVTGGAGFIGSHVVDDLLQGGANVIVYDNFTSGSRENLQAASPDIEIIEGDILDTNMLDNVMQGVDAVSHHAAQLEITRCIESPLEDLKINAEGTVNVLEAAKNAGVQKLVYASSACVYGQARFTPQDEDHPTKPNWPYGVSKLAAEHYARLYHSYYGIETTGLRYAIVYGPREWYGRVLTAFLRRALDGKPPVVWGGSQIRDFIFVDDVVRCHRRCLEQEGLGFDIYNVSSGVGTSIHELAELICSLFDLDEPLYEDVQEGEISSMVEGRMRLPAELKQMILDNEEAEQVLGWSPKVSLEEGIQREMEWLKENLHRWTQMQY